MWKLASDFVSQNQAKINSQPFSYQSREFPCPRLLLAPCRSNSANVAQNLKVGQKKKKKRKQTWTHLTPEGFFVGADKFQ